jgi:mannose-1-phosphate guanylyltransferase
MKAFLLAAGHGTRLRPLTDSIPKCLVPIRGVPLLRIWMELCRKNGISEVLINVHAHAAVVRSFLQQSSTDLKVTVSEEAALLGSAGTLLANRNWVGSDPEFWVFYADVLTTARLSSLLDLHRRRNRIATLGLYEVPDPRRCGIVTLDEDGTVLDFVEKPGAPSSNLAFCGIMVASRGLLDVIPHQIPADIGFHVLPKLCGQMAAYRVSDYLLDIGTLENFTLAQTTWPGL